MERQIIHLNNSYIPFKNKKENNSTIEKKFGQYGNKVSMSETLKEVDEDTVTKENNTLLTGDPTVSLLSGIIEYLY